MKVAIYARYSSDHQKPTSVADQIALAEEYVRNKGWTVFDHYTDPEISGSTILLRRGVQRLLNDASEGRFDVLLTEALDRISRDLEDTAGIYKRMKFAGVDVLTRSEGRITPLHIGLKGTMNQEYLADLAYKSRRGQMGRVKAGRSGGGLPYGYKVRPAKDERDRGDRQIEPDHARVIVRIFEEYTKGVSPKKIAHVLNEEGVEGPTGKGWSASTINGNRRRGTGILNNELYVGRIVFNKTRKVRSPDTGIRLSRPNPEKDWVIQERTDLRIVPQELWDAVKARQKKLDDAQKPFNKHRRPTNLLSHLLKCGECGGGFSKINNERYGCSYARNKGTCSNRTTIAQSELEHSVLNALKSHLMDKKRCELFCKEYTDHINRLRSQQNRDIQDAQKKLEKLDRASQRIITAVKEGWHTPDMKDELFQIAEEKEALGRFLSKAEEAPVFLHPSLADRYHEKIRELTSALNEESKRTEASDILRSLIEKIVLSPNADRDGLVVDLHGHLAGILSLAEAKVGQLKRAQSVRKDIDFEAVREVAGVGDVFTLVNGASSTLSKQGQMAPRDGLEPPTR